MKTYNTILQQIRDNGFDREGRNGLTRSLFAIQMRFDLGFGFPAVTTKRLAFQAVKSELLWFIEGSDSDERLKQINGTDKTIWTANAEASYWAPIARFKGDLGRIYGVQWRSWLASDHKEIDQLANVIEKIKSDPNDRRLVVTAWNPGDLDKMALPACHMLFQFFCGPGKFLSLHMVQRSCDMFLGVPFNIASYALLLSMVAHVTNRTAHELVITLNDAHIYHEHFEAVREQLSREPFSLPRLRLNPNVKDIDAFTMDDIQLENYVSHGPIRAKMIV